MICATRHLLDAIFVNLFIGSRAQLHTNETQIEIHQTTHYPWNEHVRLELNPQSAANLRIHVRLPSWCDEPKLRLNGEVITNLTVKQGYAVLERCWIAGDVVTLELPMPPQLVEAHPNVNANLGRAALRRGPLVYCLESCDNQDQLRYMYLGKKRDLRVEHRPELLGSVDTIVFDSRIRTDGRAVADLYRDEQSGFDGESIEAVAIPFFAHSNRQPAGRIVWLPDTKLLADVRKAPTIASRAQWKASHCWRGDTLAAVNDQLDVAASDDRTIPRFTWWDHRGTTEWIQCDLAEATEVREVQVYWWDERRIGAHCRTPQSWRLLTKKGGQWQPIAEQTAGGTDMDQFNIIVFPRQRLGAIRIEAKLQSDWSAGILEVRILP